MTIVQFKDIDGIDVWVNIEQCHAVAGPQDPSVVCVIFSGTNIVVPACQWEAVAFNFVKLDVSKVTP